MARAKFSAILYAAVLFAGATPALAQFSTSEPDPLARIRDAAKTNVQACSATGETLCEQVAPKIIANAQGDSPLAENVRRLAQEIRRQDRSSRERRRLGRSRHFETRASRFTPRKTHSSAGPKEHFQVLHTVVAEIRGREKPEEWVLLGARLDPHPERSNCCNAALVIEAARDIQLTGIHPRRSIRFVLFIGPDNNSVGSWAYVRTHRNELDRARAAIFLDRPLTHVSDTPLNGRQDLETGLREGHETHRVLERENSL